MSFYGSQYLELFPERSFTHLTSLILYWFLLMLFWLQKYRKESFKRYQSWSSYDWLQTLKFLLFWLISPSRFSGTLIHIHILLTSRKNISAGIKQHCKVHCYFGIRKSYTVVYNGECFYEFLANSKSVQKLWLTMTVFEIFEKSRNLPIAFLRSSEVIFDLLYY